jgi:small subunit ribosomal protein S1
VDIGGADGLHVSDISRARVSILNRAGCWDVLDLKVLRLDKPAGKISLGLKQMSPDPSKEALAKLNPGDRVTGEITLAHGLRAFVEVAPGAEGMTSFPKCPDQAHHRPGDLLKKGERVVAVVLKVDHEGAGWASTETGSRQSRDTIKERYPDGKAVEGKVAGLRSLRVCRPRKESPTSGFGIHQ